jgi:hypothetical protein
MCLLSRVFSRIHPPGVCEACVGYKFHDRRRDLDNYRPNRANAAEAPLEGAQERYHFDILTT